MRNENREVRKVKMSLSLIKHHATKMHGSVEAYLYEFLTRR
jgi:hypothetical protein